MSMFSTPFFSVAELEGQPTHEPAMRTLTTPLGSSKSLREKKGKEGRGAVPE